MTTAVTNTPGYAKSGVALTFGSGGTYNTLVAEIVNQLTAVGLSQLPTTSSVSVSGAGLPTYGAGSATLNTAWPYATVSIALCTIGTSNSVTATATFTHGSTAVALASWANGGTATTGGTAQIGFPATMYDTGQVMQSGTTPTTATGSANTANGYVIFAFNDTLQATAPIYIRLDFGFASANTNFQMWITVGSAHATGNAGNVTGTNPWGTKRACFNGGTLLSDTANYPSFFCYNAADGVAWMAAKVGGVNTTNISSSEGGFFITRSNDSSGAPTGDAAIVIANSTSVTGAVNNTPSMECLSYLTNVTYGNTLGTAGSPGTPSQGYCTSVLLAANLPGDSTNYAGQTQCFPAFYMTPTYAISAFIAAGLWNDFPPGATFSLALVGSSPHTFIALGSFAGSQFGIVSSSQSQGPASPGNWIVLLPWE